MYKISICGHFGGNKEFFDGQTVKTKNIYSELLNEYEKRDINRIDTYQWKKHPINFLKECITGIKNSRNVIILPAHNGVRVFIPLFLLLNKVYKRKIFYIVIGGWLPEFLKKRNRLLKKVKELDKVFVETNNMKDNLEKLGIKNTEILVNFKNITPLKESDLKLNYSKPYEVCTFSRVMKEKGIEDAINVVKKINEESNKIVYKLDIYGAIDKNYENRFKEIMKEMPEYIQYKGCVSSEKSVSTLKSYYLLLFPTKFKTEGIPGTIIDALFAGVPIIASKWDNVNEVISDERNGVIYKFDNLEDFEIKLKKCMDKDYVVKMKKNCLIDAMRFEKSNAIKNLTKEIEI